MLLSLPDNLLLVAPDLQQAGLETFLPQGGDQVAVDVVRDVIQNVTTRGILTIFVSPVLCPVYSCVMISLTLLLLVIIIIIIFFTPNIGVVV